MKKISLIVTTVLLICSLNVLCSCGNGKTEPVSNTGFYFDTVVAITIYDGDKEAALADCFDFCEKCDRLFDMRDENSDIYRINHASGSPVAVNEMTAEILTLGKHYSELSNGELDICCGTITSMWDFSSSEPSIPDREALAAACELIDYNNLSIEGTAVTLTGGSMVDLGAIAKGYITEKLKDRLAAYGVTRALINLGGNICAIGSGPNGEWKIGVQSPFDQNELSCVLALTDNCAVTSGTYQRYFELNGVRYYHILSTQNGMPAESDLCSATIISPDGVLCDAYSTICILYGSDKALDLINGTENCEAVFVMNDGTVIMTDGVKTA